MQNMPIEDKDKICRNFRFRTDVEEGRYLFGDYSLFDENKNFIYMTKDFVSISSNIIQIHKNADKLRFLLKNAALLHEEMILKIENLRGTAESTLDSFFREYHERIIPTIFPASAEVGFFFRTKETLNHLLHNAEKEYLRDSQEYQNYIRLKITDSYKNAITLLQSWLDKDQFNLPQKLTSTTSTTIIATIHNDGRDGYEISRLSSILLKPGSIHKSSDGESDIIAAHSLSYSFSIDISSIDFWNHRMKVSNLEIESLPIPIGFKTPISQKLKRSFRFVSPGSDENQDHVEKEPEFVAAENYFVVSAIFTGRTLSLILAADPCKLNNKVIKIEYRSATLSSDNRDDCGDATDTERKLSRIEYLAQEKPDLDILQGGFLQIIDYKKIFDLCERLAKRIDNFVNPDVTARIGKLNFVKVGDSDAIVNNTSSLGQLYSEDLVVSFLESIAAAFAPQIQKLNEKSPVKGELILRHENDNRQREEYVVTIKELNSQLSSSEEAKNISTILGL
jgi:hypothetical protein